MTPDEVVTLWERRRVPSALRRYVSILAKNQTVFDRVQYIGQIMVGPKASPQDWTAAFKNIRDSEIGGPDKPFSNPYFMIENDRQLVLAKFLLIDFRAWEFRTGKRVGGS